MELSFRQEYWIKSVHIITVNFITLFVSRYNDRIDYIYCCRNYSLFQMELLNLWI
jgi:hypothetical protein